jgi:BirA family biotin operon repressor/biotin-[acetyl-CoA-carboxylase] ligase
MAVVLPEGYRREDHAALASTNAVALERARAGDPGNLWVTAREQTAGRGRRGRAWTTGEGNLAASLLLIDPAPPALAATVSFVAGVALHQAMSDLAGPALAPRLGLKWPNDLLADGRKLSGILVEGDKLAGDRFAVVIGVGVNCVSHPEIEGPVAATDLSSLGVPIGAGQLFVRLAVRMAAAIALWRRGSGFAAIREAWLARAGGLGQPIRVSLPNQSLDGRFEDLDDDGRLVLLAPDGERRRVSAGDVFFPAPSAVCG